jgi:DNA-binding SARP family transcriptional activator
MERERLRELYLQTLMEHAELHAAEGRHVEAGELCRRILCTEPCHEPAVRRLIQLELERGFPSAAVAHFRQFEARLGNDLQARPSAETRRLYKQALEKDRDSRGT